jgi:carboxymethylenebutenolidase
VTRLRAFYATWFLNRWPADTQVTQISRTVGQGRVIDELIVTSPRRGDAGAAAGRGADRPQVVLPHVVVMGIVDGKVAYEHIYWDRPRCWRKWA